MKKSEYRVANACLDCAKEGLTCCYFRNDAYVSKVLPISKVECKNIATFLGLSSIETCFEKELITQEFQDNMRVMFPEATNIEEIFCVGEERYRFALRGEVKHCVFLASEGCILPKSIRPVLCNIFPFWVLDNGALSSLGYCKLIPKGSFVQECLHSANMNISELYALYGLLCELWGLRMNTKQGYK